MAGKKKTKEGNNAQSQPQANDVANVASYQPTEHRPATLTQAESDPAQNRPAGKQPAVKNQVPPKPGAQLDLPEGYKRRRKSSNKKRAGQNTASLPGAESTPDQDTKPCQPIIRLDNMAKRNPLAGAADKVIPLPDWCEPDYSHRD
jgi:hypothetical protein